MRTRRTKINGAVAVYHYMKRTVNGEMLFKDLEKEMLRKMLWQVADFSGVEILTYCVMSNHFHVLVRVPEPENLSDAELMRRYKVLFPKPTKYQTASTKVMEEKLLEAHRMLIFGKGSHPWTHKGKLITHEAAVKVLEKQEVQLPKTVMLRCRVRYFTDGAILGSAEFVRGFTGAWQREKARKYPPKVNSMQGANWGDLAVIQGLRRKVFG